MKVSFIQQKTLLSLLKESAGLRSILKTTVAS